MRRRVIRANGLLLTFESNDLFVLTADARVPRLVVERLGLWWRGERLGADRDELGCEPEHAELF